MKDNSNLGVAGALRDAQLSILAEAGKALPAEIAHPFFWAPFTVIGENGERAGVDAEQRPRFVAASGRSISAGEWPVADRIIETIETLGKYEIKRPLGRGAMGTVYEGWDPIIARRVAIKTVRLPDHSDDAETQEALTRFRREAQAAGRLTHPNIVGVFDYGETNDLAYIVMEFVDGPPLKNVLDKQERFALPDVIRVMDDLLTGLQFSHDRGVVHRDIKPANVMLTSAGQAKIADFGIARIESSSMTQAGTLLGTPAYMSPEQFMGQVVDARTDIYSAGVLLYQLLTGDARSRAACRRSCTRRSTPSRRHRRSFR